MSRVLSRPPVLLMGAVTWLLLFSAGCMIPSPKNVRADKGIEYAKVDGHSLKLDIYRPTPLPEKLPVIVWIHGGSWNSGDRTFCPIAFMATQQLAIVSVDYRLVGEAHFPAQLYDCKGAIRWLRTHAEEYHLDAGHIGIFGASAGGHLAALLGTTTDNPKLEGDVGGNLNVSSKVQCVCSFYPPTDLNRLVNIAKIRQDPNGDVARLIGGAVADNVDKADFASPMFYVSKDSCPFFLMHGAKDTLVPPQQSEIFYDALKQAGVEAQLEIIPDKGHGIIATPEVAKEIYEFYQRQLHYAGR